MMKKICLVLLLVAVLVLTSCSYGKPTIAVSQSPSATPVETTTPTATATPTPVVEQPTPSPEVIEGRIFEQEIVPTKTPVKKSSSPAAAKTSTSTTHKRVTTGVGQTLNFDKGSTICGSEVKINGKTFIDCVIKNAPMNGSVVSGVIWPWEKETVGLKLVSNDEILASVPTTTTTPAPAAVAAINTPAPVATITRVLRPRIATGTGNSLFFKAGDTVIGWKIVIDGKTFEGGVVLYNAPMEGTITDGVVNPWTTEVTNQKVVTISSTPTRVRAVTGPGKSLPFKVGDTVVGWKIDVNAKIYEGGYVLRNSPYDGFVTDGVVNPADNEITNQKVVDFSAAAASTKPRIATGSGNSLAFKAGDTVIGWKIAVNNKTFEGNLVLKNSPYDGFVTDGVVNPWSSEITNQTVVSP